MKNDMFEHRLLDDLMNEWSPAETRRRRPNYGRMAIMPVLVAGLTAAALIATQAGSGDNAKLDVAGSSTSTTALNDPKLIVSAVNDKVHNTKDLIFHAKQTTWTKEDRTGSFQISELWSDSAGRTRNVEYLPNSNSPSSDLASSENGNFIQVSYADKTYSSCTVPDAVGSKVDDPTNVVGNMKSDTLLGHQTIDGIDTLHLSDSEEGMNREIWVDASTMYPVRMTAHGSWGSYVFDFNWLTRDDANVKQLSASVPTGFTDVSATACTQPRSPSEAKGLKG